MPAKDVHALVTEKYFDHGGLLPDNSGASDGFNEPQLSLDGLLVVTGATRETSQRNSRYSVRG